MGSGVGVDSTGAVVAVGSGLGAGAGVGAIISVVAVCSGGVVGVGWEPQATNATNMSVTKITASADVSFALIDFYPRLAFKCPWIR